MSYITEYTLVYEDQTKSWGFTRGVVRRGVLLSSFKERCLANIAHVRQSGPDSGLGFQVKGLKTFSGVSASLGSGTGREIPCHFTSQNVFINLC